jgi:parallel beta-helix repeat protein
MKKEPVLGIDFGTTYSSMAWFNPQTGRAEVLRNAEGEEKTPSVVYYGDKEVVVVGKVAESYVEDPQACKRVLRAVKRDLAKDIRYAVGSRQVRPVEVAAKILRKLKQDAEKEHFHRREVQRVVLTHPAAFDEVEKERLREAAQEADFKEVVLLEEPVAAALAYLAAGVGPVEQGILVYDLGGRTFDLTLVVPDEGPAGFRVALPPRGLQIGGEDFDRAIYDDFDNFVRQRGASLGKDGLDLAFLKSCQKYKENLSVVEKPAEPLQWFWSEGRECISRSMTRRDFERLINAHVERTVALTRQLLREAHEKGLQAKHVLLIGGSSRIPLIQRRLKEELQTELLVWEQRDIAVALGAAIYGARYDQKTNCTNPTAIREHRLDEKGPSLGELVQRARNGDVIIIPAGDWHLRQGVIIDKPLVLRGEGAGHSRLWSGAERYVLCFQGTGPWRLEGLTVEHVGGRWANVVVVEGGQIEIRHCVCRGGVRDESNSRGGSGIWLGGGARAVISGCICGRNGLHGIGVSGQAQAQLEANICENNQQCGISYSDSARGVARHNVCRQNGLVGICVENQAQAQLESNTCENNQQCGILYSDSAGGTAQQNVCRQNGLNGIGVEGHAQPQLEGNSCEDNQQCGIMYLESAGGTARHNVCRQNGAGILVRDKAQPHLEGNTCDKNEICGIGYKESAGGVARQNVCRQNGHHGIGVNGQAQPQLEGNTCEGNNWQGIAFSEKARGLARKNTCQSNRNNGIAVCGRAQPHLESNSCENNRQCGILYSDSAGGTARQNICRHNGLHGIGVNGQAQPQLEGNTCENNTYSGIAYFDSAGGSARQNACRHNGLHGIGVHGQAQPQLEGNSCEDNRQCGIMYLESAGGTARQNVCRQNPVGVGVQGLAQPHLEGNTCENNKNCGILYRGSAGGIARQNVCRQTPVGIRVRGQAQPQLEGNTCENNQQCGILYSDSAGGTARRNVCRQNGYHGVGVDGQAQPQLEANTCENNKYSGIAYFDSAGGTARQNVCRQNGYHGIGVQGQAQPQLEGNTCENNQQCGIAVLQILPGARRGRMSAGRMAFMASGFRDQAQPQLEGNTCENNRQCGIMYVESAGGMARQNVCRQNGYHGIGVQWSGTAAIGKQHLREQPAKRNSLLRLCRRACAAKHLFGQSAVWHLCSFHGKACAGRQ